MVVLSTLLGGVASPTPLPRHCWASMGDLMSIQELAHTLIETINGSKGISTYGDVYKALSMVMASAISYSCDEGKEIESMLVFSKMTLVIVAEIKAGQEELVH